MRSGLPSGLVASILVQRRVNLRYPGARYSAANAVPPVAATFRPLVMVTAYEGNDETITGALVKIIVPKFASPQVKPFGPARLGVQSRIRPTTARERDSLTPPLSDTSNRP